MGLLTKEFIAIVFPKVQDEEYFYYSFWSSSVPEKSELCAFSCLSLYAQGLIHHTEKLRSLPELLHHFVLA